MKYIVLLIIALFIIVACKRHGHQPNASMTMNKLLKDEVRKGERIIIAKQMAESEILKAVDDFITLNANNGSPIEKPVLTQDNGDFRLQLPDGTSYDLFCYWVNYLVYSDKEKRHNDNIVGWYEVPSEATGSWTLFSGQRLKFLIPDTDSEYDNVYFITEDHRCYKQEFANEAALIPVDHLSATR